MATITEKLVLKDVFSETFARYIKAAQKAASATADVQKALYGFMAASQITAAQQQASTTAAQQNAGAQEQAAQDMTAAHQAAEALTQTLGALTQAAESTAAAQASMADSAQHTAASLTAAAEAAMKSTEAMNNAARHNQRFRSETHLATQAASGMVQELKRLASAYLSIQGLKKAVDLSDSLVSMRARLDRMNDGLQTTQELETMIYQSAQRSRGSFTDTMGLVSQLGTMAGDAFNSSKEIVQFAEQLNKQLALSGASGQSAQAAILQLEQGLASGVLRGDELNSVMEQAPALAKSIADYMQVSVGQLREMGSKGQITADIVKNALFDAAQKTNAEFEKTPMTWAQVWTVATNTVVRALDPLLTAINWVANNLETIGPIVLSVGAAFVVFETLTHLTQAWTVAITAAKTALALIGPQGFAIAALAGIIYGASGSFMEFASSAQNAAGMVLGGFAALGAWLYNSFAVPLMTMFAAAGNFVRNVFNDPVQSIEYLFYDLEISVLKVFRNIADGAGKLLALIPGWENNIVTNFASFIDEKISQTSYDLQYAKRAGGYKTYYKAPKEIDLGKAYQTGYNFGSNLDIAGIFGKTGNVGTIEIPQAANITDLLSNINKSTGKIAKTVDMSDEQIKMLVDVAERKYINNYNRSDQVQQVFNINGQNTGNTKQDAQAIADILRDKLVDLMNAGSYVTVG